MCPESSFVLLVVVSCILKGLTYIHILVMSLLNTIRKSWQHFYQVYVFNLNKIRTEIEYMLG